VRNAGEIERLANILIERRTIELNDVHPRIRPLT
jgi:hypothetical protein